MFSLELQCAIRASNEARKICQYISSSSLKTIWKMDLSPVTLADYASQLVICREIKKNFPLDSILAEEDLSLIDEKMLNEINESLSILNIPAFDKILPYLPMVKNGPRTWVIDPIDGTKGFLKPKENGQYAICIALVNMEEPSILLGLLSCPRLNYCQYATKGGGSYEFIYGDDDMLGNPYPIKTDSETLEKNIIMVSSIESRGHSLSSFVSGIHKKNSLRNPILEMDSQCKYSLIARGDAHIYARKASSPDYEEKLWDHAAGWLIVEEAGGHCCDTEGATLIRKENFTPNGFMPVKGILALSKKEMLILFKK